MGYFYCSLNMSTTRTAPRNFAIFIAISDIITILIIFFNKLKASVLLLF